MKRGQSSIELIIIKGAVLFFVTSFMLAVELSSNDTIKQRRSFFAKDIAATVVDEVNLAHSTTDGYSRTFVLPLDINGLPYPIQIVSGLVYLNSLDGSIALALPISDVIGNAQVGGNFIWKENGQVYLNSGISTSVPSLSIT